MYAVTHSDTRANVYTQGHAQMCTCNTQGHAQASKQAGGRSNTNVFYVGSTVYDMDEYRRPRTGRFYFNTNISCAGSSIRYEWTSREGRAQAGFNSIPMFLAQGAVYDMDEYRRPRRMRVWSRTLERSGRCVFVCVLCVSLYFVQ